MVEPKDMSLSITPISFYLLSSVLLQLIIVAGSNGFSIKLIHRDSIDSPLYPGNLTFEKKLERIYHQSEAHLMQLVSTTKGANGIETIPHNLVKVPIEFFNGEIYLAQVGIGTFNTSRHGEKTYKLYYLLVDTGSSTTWTQCKHADRWFHQKTPLFPAGSSRSYRSIKCREFPLCQPGHCRGGTCSYNFSYADGGISTGILATETFTFELDDQHVERIPNLVFGCGTNQRGFPYAEPTDVTGILALGRGQNSLVTQVLAHIHGEDRRFSYCLQPWRDDRMQTYLRFGSDAYFRIRRGNFSTQLYKIDGIDEHYFVKLETISIAGERVNLPPGSFDLGPDVPGCILDTGSTLTYIRQREYEPIIAAFVSYFHRHNFTRQSKHFGLDLCYKYNRRSGFSNFPNMVYHFKNNASFEVVPKELFFVAPSYFCLSIKSTNLSFVSVIIGNRHQTNHRFIYDLHKSQLQFAKEGCGPRA